MKHQGINTLVLFALALFLSGCSSTVTTCPLNNKEGYCASVGEVNSAAKSRSGNNENVFGGGAHERLEKSGASGKSVGSRVDSGVFDPGPGAGLAGPIYTPAEPRRLWVAPWTDANGVVHSGEYLYFLRPGHWRYGALEAPGSASGALGPVSPKDLGFDPAKQKEKNRRGALPRDSGDIERPVDTFAPPTPEQRRRAKQ